MQPLSIEPVTRLDKCRVAFWIERVQAISCLTNEMTESSIHKKIRTQEKEPIRKHDTKRNNQSTPWIQSLHCMKSRDKRAETHTSFDMSRKSKSKDQTKALNILFTLTKGDLVL
jgi:hypothetical protein